MDIINLLETSLFKGYSSSELNINTIFICIGFAAIISTFVYFIYKMVKNSSFYNKYFNLSLIALSIITASVIITIQSNVVVSLGMVGALSIVRFRTAIKDPLDLVFLFWSISIGIICGAGYAMIAIIASIVLSIIIILFDVMPSNSGSVLLVVDCLSNTIEEEILNIVGIYSKKYVVRARNATEDYLNLAIEINTNKQSELLSNLLKNGYVKSASIVEHNGDITA